MWLPRQHQQARLTNLLTRSTTKNLRASLSVLIRFKAILLIVISPSRKTGLTSSDGSGWRGRDWWSNREWNVFRRPRNYEFNILRYRIETERRGYALRLWSIWIAGFWFVWYIGHDTKAICSTWTLRRVIAWTNCTKLEGVSLFQKHVLVPPWRRTCPLIKGYGSFMISRISATK